MFILPGSEIFQRNPAQNFDQVAPLLLVFFHSVWEKLWLLIASSHLWIEKGGKNPLIFLPSGGKEGGVGARGDVVTVSCHPSWNPKSQPVCHQEARPCLPRADSAAVRRCQEAKGSLGLTVRSCGEPSLILNPTAPGWPLAPMGGCYWRGGCGQGEHGWVVPPASQLPPVQVGQHPLMCKDIPAAPHRV